MKKYYIIIPLYNDWKSLWKLSKAIDDQVKDLNLKFSFLFINDASIDKQPSNLNLKNIESVTILHLKKNVLSGRGIATGLKYLVENENFDDVIVMDADGEDKPEDIKKFIRASVNNSDKTICSFIEYIEIFIGKISTFVKLNNFVSDNSVSFPIKRNFILDKFPIIRGRRFFRYVPTPEE